MSAVSPPFVLQAGSHPASTFRQMLQAVTGSPFGSFAGGMQPTTGGGGHGVCRPTDLLTTQNGTPNMSVNVAGGLALVRGTENTHQGVYAFYNDGTVNLAISAADPTNPRRDAAVVRVRDAAYSGASNDVALVVVTGTPAASPSDPTLPANALVLDRVAVSAADTSITNAEITRLAPRAAALGGRIACTSSTRPTGGALSAGVEIIELDTQRIMVYSGAAWIWIASLNGEAAASLWYTTGSNVDGATGAGFTDWMTIGNVTIPTWATKARCRISANGLTYATASGNVHGVRMLVSNGTGNTSVISDAALTRWGFSLTEQIGFTNTGAQSLKLQTQRQSGSGVPRADTGTSIGALIEWLP